MEIENKISATGLLVWLSCALFFMYEFILRTIIGTFQPQIMADLSLTPFSFSLLSTTGYSLVYGLMQIPVGIISARIGLKKSLFMACLLCTVSTAGFALSNQFGVAMLCRIAMGFGSSFGFVSLLIAVYDWMPRKSIAFYIGISQFIGTMGPMMAAGPLHSLSQTSALGWRSIFCSMAAIGLMIALLVLLFVKENRLSSGKFIILTNPPAITKSLLNIMSQKQLWYIALFSAVVYFSVEYLSENIGVEFLVSKGLSSFFSSYMITCSWLGYAIGCPLLGFVSDKIQRRKPIMLASSLIALVSLVEIIYFPLGKTATALCFLLLGVSASGQSIGFAVIAEQCKKEHLGSVLGFNNAMISLLSATGAPLIGSILSSSAHMHNYKEAMLVLVIFALIGVLVSAFAIKETFCKSMRSNLVLSLESAT
jgi:MFS family permease